jgi:hypothetical protein
MNEFAHDTVPSPPPEGCSDKQDFASRMMSIPPSAGQRRPTTWQQTHEKDPSFNARGCR